MPNLLSKETALKFITTVVMSMGLFVYNQSVNAASCTPTFTSSVTIPITGSIGDMVFDSTCQHLYVTNTTNNRVDVINPANGALGNSIPVGASPRGLDTSPDGSTLYVANSGGTNISIVDLAQGVETQKVTVPSGSSGDTPYSLAVASNGLVLFSTTFSGSGFGGRLMQLDPVTLVPSVCTDFWYSGTTTEVTTLRASADKSVISIVAGDISSGPVFQYMAQANTFTPEKDLNAFLAYASSDTTGQVTLVNPGTYVLDASLNQTGMIPSSTGYYAGIAVDPSGKIGYRVTGNNVDVLDLSSFLVTAELPLSDTMSNTNSIFPGIGRMAISQDGALLAVVTDNGITLVNTGIAKAYAMASVTGKISQSFSTSIASNSFSSTVYFSLAQDSDGIDPLTETVTFQLGSLSATLAPGSFSLSNRGAYVYSGTLNGVQLSLEIKGNGSNSYRLRASGQGNDWTGLTFPPSLSLSIGNDQGSVSFVSGSASLQSQ